MIYRIAVADRHEIKEDWLVRDFAGGARWYRIRMNDGQPHRILSEKNDARLPEGLLYEVAIPEQTRHADNMAR